MLKNKYDYMVKKKGNKIKNIKNIICRKHYTINDYFMNKEQHLVDIL